MVDLAKIVKLVEGALEELPVKEVSVDTVSVLHELQSKISIIIKALATQDFAIL